jgi:hypothetical protein
MPSLRRWLTVGWLGRSLVRELKGLRLSIEAQNALLTRLADHFAPPTEAATPVDERAVSVDHLNEVEMGLVLAYVERFRADFGQSPTEEDIVAYLAEDRTVALQQALSERSDLLHRLGRR